MLTSTDLDKDPQLKGMLWDDAVAALEANAENFTSVFSEASKSVTDSLANVFTVYLARHPNVDALAFSLTKAEYDDETYGGYDFTEIRPRFIPDAVTSSEALEFISEYAEYYGGFVDTHFYGYGKRQVGPNELLPALNEANELDRLLEKVRTFAEHVWSDCGIIVTREAISRFHGNDDLNAWAGKR